MVYVISITVTKGGHLKGSRLYKISKTIGRGVAELRSQFNIDEYRNVKTHVIYRRIDVLTYSTITIRRSYIFKYTVFTIK